MRKNVERIHTGDLLLCYLTGVMRWVGALEVIGPSTEAKRIWTDAEFPARLAVKALVLLSPENSVPMGELEARVSLFTSSADRGKFKGFVRMSPNLFRSQAEGDLILAMLHEAERAPVSRPVDAGKLARRPLFKAERRHGKETVPAVVSVPESEQADDTDQSDSTNRTEAGSPARRHTEMQYHLMTLGAEMGFDVWVAHNDRSQAWNSKVLGRLPRVIDELPTQFNDATNRTIELIDVLWLKGNSIVAAFEVECTSSVDSGLLRMSDLLALQPNLEISLDLVAPDDRQDKVKQEILRPAFSLREKPLAEVCGFLSFGRLAEQVEGIGKPGLAGSVKPDFLRKTADFFTADNDD